MPIFNVPITKLDKNECKRYAGLTAKTDFPDELIVQACLEAQALSIPRGIWQIYPYNNTINSIIAKQPIELTGRNIVNHLKYAEKVAVLAVTIGLQLETEVTRLFEIGNYTQGLLLDAAGTTTIEASADIIAAIIKQSAERQGLLPLSRFSPGYGDWNITNQPDILALAGAAQIDIQLTTSYMLLPRKSISAVIGLVPNTAINQESIYCKENTCQNCTKLNCMARKGSYDS